MDSTQVAAWLQILGPMTRNTFTALVLVTLSLTASANHAYKTANAFANPAAWYVGSWKGTNLAFEPSLAVELSILPDGAVYTYVHGHGQRYVVNTHGKRITIPRLTDTPMRGKMRDAQSMILEDGGVIIVQRLSDLLQTTVEKMGIRVFYQHVEPGPELEAIRARIADQMATEPHHKDHDFWHTEEFWGHVIGAAIANPQRDSVHIDNTPTLSKGDAKALQRYYGK